MAKAKAKKKKATKKKAASRKKVTKKKATKKKATSHQEEGHQEEGHQEEGHQEEGHQEEGHQEEGHQEEGQSPKKVVHCGLGHSCAEPFLPLARLGAQKIENREKERSVLRTLPGSEFHVRFGIWNLRFGISADGSQRSGAQRSPRVSIRLSMSLISRGAVWESTW